MKRGQCSIHRGRALGGSSNVNGMIYIRGNREDYDHWAHDLGNRGWSYEDVLPYFKKAESQGNPRVARDTRHHGTAGPLSVEQPNFRSK